MAVEEHNRQGAGLAGSTAVVDQGAGAARIHSPVGDADRNHGQGACTLRGNKNIIIIMLYFCS